MKIQAKTLVVTLAFVVSFFVGNGNSQELPRYIVTIQAPAEEAADAVIRAGGNVIHVYTIIPAIAIQIPEQALAGLQHNPLVVSIERDSVVTAFKKPVKPQPPSQALPWGVDRIDAEYAWGTSSGAGARVAVIDTGIDYTHPDLDDNYVGGINIISPRKSPMDDNGHGTHVAGIIAALDNGIGVVGVAPEASLYAVKVLSRSGFGWTSDIIAGVDWCAANGMDVANMSLGGGSFIGAFQEACTAASEAGVILVAAAGNDGGDVSYPAAYENVIAVSATDDGDHVASWSNFGPRIDIAAPGVDIYSTYKGGGYATLSGTSMAAPHVAGVLALADSWYDVWSTADNLGLSTLQQGAGLVDAEQAATGSENGDD